MRSVVRFAMTSVCVSQANARTLRSKWVEVEIGDKDCLVDDYGATGNGKTDDTLAIQKALDDCGQAGGRVTMKEGRTYLCKALNIMSKTELNIPFGSVLLIDNHRETWPAGLPIITAHNVNNVAVTGPGKLDGQGLIWWENRDKDKYDKNRPKTLVFGGSNALVHNLTFVNPPNHVMEMYTDHTEISHVTVLAPASTAPVPSHNTDAVDVHGSPFYVHDCHFDTGDDNIAAHANDTLVEDCYFGNGHGASIGSIGNGKYLKNITFRNLIFNGTDAGPKIKVRYDANHGRIWNVTYENLMLNNSKDPISVTFDYDKDSSQTHTSTYVLENIVLRNITSYASQYSGELCRAGGVCKDFVFEDINFVSSTEWTCDDRGGTSKSLASLPKKGCDCFTGVRGRSTNVSPDISKCLQMEKAFVV